MRHGIGHRKLNRPTAHRISMLRNMCASLIQYEHITTTEARAKEVRAEVEHLITTAKRGDLHARRMVAAELYDEGAARKLFDVIAPKYAARTAGPGTNGGYTRIYHIGLRKGDASRMARLELVPYDEPAAPAR
jgi:large subunit ribosomal protein L17